MLRLQSIVDIRLNCCCFARQESKVNIVKTTQFNKNLVVTFNTTNLNEKGKDEKESRM